MIIDTDEEVDYIAHYGILRKSGRYPWGSGKDQYTRNKGFLQYFDEMKKKGLSEKDIAVGLSGPTKREEVSIAQLRDARRIALNENKLANIQQAEKLSAKHWSNRAIAERMGLAGESSVRALLAPGVKEATEKKLATTKMLKDEVERKKVIDVGRGVEANLMISETALRAAVNQLREQGYNQYLIPQPQASGQHDTKIKVLALPEITQKEIWQNRSMIQQIDMVTSDDGKSYRASKKHDYVAIDPKRLEVIYGDEGGSKADGVIFVRRGVEDLSLGKARYAQVRIKIGDDHFAKGMALYNDDLPKGVDLVFNTNKSRKDAADDAARDGYSDPKLGALKLLKKENQDYPFGSIVKPQVVDRGKDTERVVSAMNIVNEEGDWEKWKGSIASQTLSKQAPSLAKKQLDKVYAARKKEYEDIMALTNPAVKRKLLETFSDATDKSAVHLKAAGLDRQNWHVILPVDSLKPSEIYAPKYKHGEAVVLIRYPHGGKFEIPELTVNNRHRKAIAMLGKDPLDAVGIHHSVAERLSGADFDGDTVLVIPNNKKIIKVDPALASLKGFDAKQQYKLPAGQKSRINTQLEMGKVSNLITDMTLLGAPNDQIARAVKHSMVVIDADKHNLDYKRSAKEHSISELKERYQGKANAGAATLISRAGARQDLPERKARPHPEGGPIDKETGALVYVPTGKIKKNPDGTPKFKRDGTPDWVTQQHKKLAVTEDANKLVSVAETRVEKIYAEHSNRLKKLANQSRVSMVNQPSVKTNPGAKKAFAKEVESLNSKLARATMNSPRERQAQVIAEQIVKAERASNPNLDKSDIQKIKFRAIDQARKKMGVQREKFEITKDEWAAIQAGAVSDSRLRKILDKADLDVVKQLATPRTSRVLSKSDIGLAQRLLAGGATRQQVADRLGVSLTTIDTYTIGDAEEDD